MRILVIKTSSLGDIIHGLRVVASLKNQLPGLHVTWVAQDVFAPIVEVCAEVDETVIYRRRQWGGFFGVLKALGPRRFDAVLDLQGRLLTGLMTARCRADRKIGRTDCREGSGFFYREKVPLPAAGRRSHALDILLQFCGALGAKIELRGAPVFREADGLKIGFPDIAGEPGPVVMFPDSRRQEKCWGGFAELTEILLRSNERSRIIWAGDRALPFASEATQGGRFLNLTGRSSLASLPALVRRASWVISNDSGPMHLAAALGVKVFGIFGPTDTVLYGPYPLTGANNFFVRAPQGNLQLLPPAEVFCLLGKIDPAAFDPAGPSKVDSARRSRT
jgi:ADP-heptose:LPS heptosyltransferase